MDINLKEKFMKSWEKYFTGAELPIIFYYTAEPKDIEITKPAPGHRCIFADIAKTRKGKPICMNVESIGCFGGKRYLGYRQELMPNFEYFLSCGIEGKLEGERYKKTPELVNEFMTKAPAFKATAQYAVFKRWDMLEQSDEPEVVIFMAKPDVIAGLFTLANYDEPEPNAVFAPFGAGCGSIIQYPYLEKLSKRPRAVLGLFDISARPFVEENILSFSVPMEKFITMIGNMEESFLITKSWQKIKTRIKR